MVESPFTSNPSVFTSYGYLAHHDSISKQFTFAHIEKFFAIVLKQMDLSKKSLSLAVWCLGVQRFTSVNNSMNPLEPHALNIFKAIRVAIRNPYQSHTTTAEAMNTLLVILNQLQEICTKYVTLWLVDVIECLISPNKRYVAVQYTLLKHTVFVPLLRRSQSTWYLRIYFHSTTIRNI